MALTQQKKSNIKGIQIFLMTRKGKFDAKSPTNNQCKVKGHIGYNYTIKIAVEGVRASLDNDGFIIDHVDIDSFVKNCGLKGSCEDMHLIISTKFPAFLKRKNIKLLGYCCQIKPVGEDVMAFMEYVKVVNGDHTILPLLSI